MLQLDYRSSDSLYIQIKNNFKKLILSGALKENDILPSVRTLASELAINVNTVCRAYRELEQEGYIYSVPGKGNFVSKINDNITENNYKELREEIFIILKKSKLIGVNKEKIISIVNEFFDSNLE